MDAVIKRVIGLTLACGLFSACSGGTPAAQQAGTQIAGATGCENFQTQFWDQMYKTAESETQPLSLSALRASMNANLQPQSPDIQKVQSMTDALVDAVSAVDDTVNASSSGNIPTREERMGKVAALELGVNDTVELQQANSRLATVMAKVDSVRAQNIFACSTSHGTTAPPAVDDNAFFESLKQSRMPSSYGAIKAMSTAYQRCDMAQLPLLTQSVPALQGLTTGGTNNSGGTLRRITDLAALQRTHPYIQNFQLLNPSCFDVKGSPLLYDYGGKPYATSDPASSLDFFTKQSTGSGHLGVDCSGFVFTSLASAGLKLKSTATLRGSQVYLYSSAAYNSPSANGLDCLQPIQMNGGQTLQAGDIVAGSGHVILIDSVGADPFGLSQITTLADCDTKVKAANFDFTISQSSASQGGIGINRYKGSEYLAGVTSYRTGLERIAHYACYSKFKTQTPPPSSTINVVRHTGTPQCVAQEVSLARSSCVASCGQ